MQAIQRIGFPHPELWCVYNTVKPCGLIFHKLPCCEGGVLFFSVHKHPKMPKTPFVHTTGQNLF